ncbi:MULTISPECIES: hypothetical protein [unclassified Plantactinospora]|uniref:hypothetical protein n=1 Tax=unclassified Plantactinospora TaxID=2631981 RepID=UPI000D176005|nr:MULTISPECIES: hypothetical protein [unclassified Plantactinospora]AVT31301.1 hypothetical protein C6361_19485 [Plantactinospora sp. BC1]AVT39834.1 hypothetical protein C6W10_29095 [Plantactinospora sp. BB1]
MTVDGEVRSETDPPTAPGPVPAPVSRATVAAYATVAVLLACWVLFGWLVQQQGFVDSLGEGLGAAFTLLLIVSVVGSLRQHPRD